MTRIRAVINEYLLESGLFQTKSTELCNNSPQEKLLLNRCTPTTTTLKKVE